MSKVLFAMGLHNHQPVGNFDHVIEDAFQKSYLPFLDILENHPKIRLSFHFTGVLLDWIQAHHPEYITRLSRMVASNQIEMISGAHYEPLLMAIPDEDKLGQIRKLTERIIDLTGYRPRGFWLAERVWEPHLPKIINEAGATYTILDDAHFKYAGLRSDQLSGYYVTEEQGSPLYVFPISERLRYTIPFEEPQETLSYIEKLATQGENNVAIFADDGEKFGVWPGTHEHVFTDGWLEAFFTLLENASDQIEMVHFSEVLAKRAPLGTVYLPSASYREMMEWALPCDSTRELEDFEAHLKQEELFDQYGIYVRGGFWRNFLAKYPEANRMHKKMLHVSRKVKEASERMSPDELQAARDFLWAGQCNCSYWHGVFGGLYLPHLRHAIYQNLISAENVVSRLTDSSQVHFVESDFSGDGENSVMVETREFNVYINPHNGGSIFELDYKPLAINLLDTMTRREEAYHRKLLQENKNKETDGVASIHDQVILKEENLREYLKFDSYQKNSLLDHFLPVEATLEQFEAGDYREYSDFVDGRYDLAIEEPDTIKLTRAGEVRYQDRRLPVRLEKRLRFHTTGGALDIHYTLVNLSDTTASLLFLTEWNIGLLAGHAPDRYYDAPGSELKEKHLDSRGALPEVGAFSLVDEWQNLRVDFEYASNAQVWRFPVETVSISESGFERVFQSSSVLAGWPLTLNPNQQTKLSLKCRVKHPC